MLLFAAVDIKETTTTVQLSVLAVGSGWVFVNNVDGHKWEFMSQTTLFSMKLIWVVLNLNGCWNKWRICLGHNHYTHQSGVNVLRISGASARVLMPNRSAIRYGSCWQSLGCTNQIQQTNQLPQESQFRVVDNSWPTSTQNKSFTLKSGDKFNTRTSKS